MTTTCAKCGTENAVGDAFCGSCGAFLEFAAEEAAEATAGAGGPPSAASPAGTPPAGEDAMPTIVAAATPPPPPGPTIATPSPSAAGPICGACGRANPAGRTFCISCGERLEAAPAGDGGAPAAGPASAGKPAWDFPTGPLPTAMPAASAAADAEASGGGSRLPLIVGGVVVVALLAVGGLFVLGGGLGGGTAVATASPVPSGVVPSSMPSGEPSGEPTVPPASAEPTASPTPVATIPPGPAVGIKITKARSSSQLSSARAPKNIHDGSPATTWKSASGKFEGAWIEVTFAPAAVTRLQVWGGWQRGDELYFGNHRPHNVTLSFDGGDPIPLELKDVQSAQRVDIPPELGIVRASTLRITVLDTYPSRDTGIGGSPSTQVAICELRLFGVPVTP